MCSEEFALLAAVMCWEVAEALRARSELKFPPEASFLKVWLTLHDAVPIAPVGVVWAGSLWVLNGQAVHKLPDCSGETVGPIPHGKVYFMRNIRRAALAGATALAISLTGVAAHAADAPAAEKSSVDTVATKVKDALGSSEKNDETEASETAEAPAPDYGKFDVLGSTEAGSSALGKKLEAEEPVKGRDIYGSSLDNKDVPLWGKFLQVGSVAAVIGAFLGLVVFPVYNFLKFNGFIR